MFGWMTSAVAALQEHGQRSLASRPDRHQACRWLRLCWTKRRFAGEMPMTAPQARPPQILPRPAVRAVLAANAGDAVLRRYDQDLDMAFEQARARRPDAAGTDGAPLVVRGRRLVRS